MSNSLQSLHTNPLGYDIDVVFCIDATATMIDHAEGTTIPIDVVKKHILNIHKDFTDYLNARGNSLQHLRARIILFRDYIADGEHAMLQTDFFRLPQEEEKFREVVNSISCGGGGDLKEDGLEALAYAIRSNWDMGPRKRNVIIVWTDAGTHELGYGKTSQWYPRGMAKNIEELGDWWESMYSQGKRLILFAPQEDGWSYISDNWNMVWHIPEPISSEKTEMLYEQLFPLCVHAC